MARISAGFSRWPTRGFSTHLPRVVEDTSRSFWLLQVPTYLPFLIVAVPTTLWWHKERRRQRALDEAEERAAAGDDSVLS